MLVSSLLRIAVYFALISAAVPLRQFNSSLSVCSVSAVREADEPNHPKGFIHVKRRPASPGSDDQYKKSFSSESPYPAWPILPSSQPLSDSPPQHKHQPQPIHSKQAEFQRLKAIKEAIAAQKEWRQTHGRPIHQYAKDQKTTTTTHTSDSERSNSSKSPNRLSQRSNSANSLAFDESEYEISIAAPTHHQLKIKLPNSNDIATFEFQIAAQGDDADEQDEDRIGCG
jgi:hypothetical protein